MRPFHFDSGVFLSQDLSLPSNQCPFGSLWLMGSAAVPDAVSGLNDRIVRSISSSFSENPESWRGRTVCVGGRCAAQLDATIAATMSIERFIISIS